MSSINLNSSVFAEAGARMVNGDVYVRPYHYVGDIDGWRFRLRQARAYGAAVETWDPWFSDVATASRGNVIVRHEYGYAYLYVIDVFGDWICFGFTADPIAKVVEKEELA